MTFKQLLKWLIGWRLLLLLFAAIGMGLLPFGDRFPYREPLLVSYGHPLFYSWAGFDGVHYLGIATSGYSAAFTQAFFPLYPLIIRWWNFAVHNYLLTGLFISHLSLLIALYYLYQLVRLDNSASVSQKTLLLLLLFPTSFFFGSLYTESLFLMFVVTSFYFMRTHHPIKAILMATLASATRIIGVFLIPALILERYDSISKKSDRTKPWGYLPYLFPAAGLLSYMYYLGTKFADPLYFLNAQPAFGADRSTDKIILLYQVIYRYLRMVSSVKPATMIFYTVSQEFIVSMLFLGLSLWAFKKLRKSYATYAFLAFITPTLTGTFSSMPRYVLVLFPCFILLARIKSPLLTKVWLTISLILLCINTILFTRGYWVA